MNKYANLMRSLMAVPLGDVSGKEIVPLTEQDLVAAERRLGANIPKDYWHFISEFGNFLVPFASVTVQDPTGNWDAGVERFIKISGQGDDDDDAVKYHFWSKAEGEGQLDDLIVVAVDAGSSSVMLAFKGEFVGNVYFVTGNLEKYLIAQSFDDFLNLLFNRNEPIPTRKRSEEFWQEYFDRS